MKLCEFKKNQAKDLRDKKVLHIKGLKKTRKTNKVRERFTQLLASTNNDNINTKCTSYD